MNKFIKFLYSFFVLISIMTFVVDTFLQPIVFLAILATTFLIGFIRVSSFHPRFSNNYLNWILMSPWKGETLPKGTVLLTGKDLLLQVAVLVVSYFTLPEVFFILPTLAFLGGYNLALTMTLDKKAIFLPAILIPLCFILALTFPILLIPFAILTAFNSYLFLEDRAKLFPKKVQTLKTISSQINPLFPGRKYLEISSISKLLIALCAFLWSFALVSIFESDESLIDSAESIFNFALFAAILKYVFYMQISCSGFFYRIKHFILWDYKYDRILFAPLAIFLSGFILSETLSLIEWPAIASIPLGIFIIVNMVLFLGTTYKEWLLTGKLCLYKPSEIQMANRNKSNIKITQ